MGCSTTTKVWTSSGLHHGHRRIESRTEDEEPDKSGFTVDKRLELGKTILQENTQSNRISRHLIPFSGFRHVPE